MVIPYRTRRFLKNLAVFLLALVLTLVLRVFGTTLVLYWQHRGGKRQWHLPRLRGGSRLRRLRLC